MEGKVVAISGGSSGMGLALAKILAGRGAKLSICDVVQENLDKAVKEIEAEDLLTFRCDVRDLSQVHEWISKTVEKFGQLDGAANMAGIIGKRPGSNFIADQEEDDWERIMGINVTGVMHCLKEELKVMQNQPSGGSIVNASSTAGLIGLAGHAAYCASKHAVVGLTKCCARDYAKKGIRVNAIAPGVTETPMQTEIRQTHATAPEDAAKMYVPFGRLGEPKELANVIAFLLSDEASFVSGSVYVADGAWISGY